MSSYKRIASLTRPMVALLLVMALLLPGAMTVAAAGPVKYVDAALGNDTTGDGSIGSPYKTIQKGIDDVDAGGTVYVAAGTYNEKQVSITKAVTVLGAGIDASIIDGGGGTDGLTQAGTVNIQTAGNVTLSGFTIRNPDSQPILKGGVPLNLRIGIQAQNSTAPGGNTFTITRVKIVGTNGDTEEEDYGLYAHGSYASLIFQWNQITRTGANAILIEQHYGATDVSYNTWDVGCYGTDGYFSMTYGGATISTLQKVHHNTIDVSTGTGTSNTTGITFAAAPDFATGNGTYTNVEITDNHISGLKDKRRGIGLWCGTGGGGGAVGLISDAKITGNVITGTGSGTNYGIRLLGNVTGAMVQHNQVTNADTSFLGAAWNGYNPTSPLVRDNVFSGNTTGLVWPASPVAELNAENNWWGNPSGPGTVGSGTGDHVSANVDYTPWAAALVSMTPAQQSMYVGEERTVDLKITANNLYGLQMKLEYDPAQLEVITTTWDTSWFSPDYKAWDMITTTLGEVKIAASQQRDLHPTPISGVDQPIAHITFKCLAAGVDHLSLEQLILSEIDAAVISSTYSSACLINTGPEAGTVTAHVRLQGRTDWSGAVLTLWPGGYSGTSNSAGDIAIGSVPPGTYTATLSMARYLDTEKTGVVVAAGGSTDIAPRPKLLGGDVNDDDHIELSDLSMIAGVFGTGPYAPSIAMDINNDGYINILDLVLAAGNYDTHSIVDVPW